MLSLLGRAYRHCDGLTRRSFLTIGGLTVGGLSLTQLLRAEAQSQRPRRHKSVIMIFLSGGPPHQDLVDLKMDAPAEIRGEFRPIATSVPGIQICEYLPRLAATMEKWTIIRSLVGSEGRHASFQCHTGWPVTQQPAGGWPSFGAYISKVQGLADPGIPSYVSLFPKMKGKGWADPGQAGFVGAAHAPFTPNASGAAAISMGGISVDHLSSRVQLARQMDRLQREADATGAIAGMDAYQQQAFGILTAGKLAAALDLDQEDPALRDRYGRGSPEPAGYGDAGPLMNDYFLTARRLVEAGARVVTLAYGRWDWHGRPHGTTFDNARDHFPRLDQGLTALVEDLERRGMMDDVSIVVWGEFGRTPRINKNGGRDHWPSVGCAMLAGGGMRTGQVIGATDRLGDHAVERPVHFQEVLATLYHQMGIDIEQTTVPDFSGRPRYLVDHTRYRPLAEVV
ncbi:MAG: DUF1501 domain-containing protein [Pirellulaceae bacterium]